MHFARILVETPQRPVGHDVPVVTARATGARESLSMSHLEPRRFVRTGLRPGVSRRVGMTPLSGVVLLRSVNFRLKVQRRPKAVSRGLATALQDGKRRRTVHGQLPMSKMR